MSNSRHAKPVVAVVVMSDIASDVRVVRHLNALKEKFHLITVGYGPSPDNSFTHIQIPNKLNYLPLNIAAMVPHLLKRFEKSSQRISAIQYVAEQLSRFHIDVVLLNDVATLPLIARVKVPTVVDMHEFAPLEQESDWRFNLFLRGFNTWLCETYLPRATRVTTVSDGLAARYRKDFSIDPVVIYNARDELRIPIRPTTTPRLRLIHTGLAARARRLDVMIDAVSKIPHMTLDLFLVEAPYQSHTLTKLMRMSNRTSNVRVRYPVTSSRIPEVINTYDLSLVYISDSDFSLRHAMPNKLFDSVQARTGVVTGPSIDLQEFCATHKVGVSSARFGVDELVSTLNSLTLDEVNQFKQNANHIAARINSDSEGKKLQTIIENLLCE